MSNTGKIGLITAIIISMNAMIGAGIFSAPAKLLLSVGPAAIITYLIVIASVLTIALTMAKVAQMYPNNGSFYEYTKVWSNKYLAAFVTFSYIMGLVISLSIVAKLAASYLNNIVPSLDYNLIGILIIFIPILIIIAKPQLIQLSQFLFLSATLFSLITIIILGFINIDMNNMYPFMPNGYISIFQAIPTVIFAFFGFESSISLFSIVENPEKNVPKALVISIILVGLIYVSFVSSIIFSIPKIIFSSTSMPLPLAISLAFPKYNPWLPNMLYLSMVTALLGVFQSLLYSVSNLSISFAKVLSHDFKGSSLLDILVKNRIYILLLIAFIVSISFFAISKIDVFFNLASICLISPFITSMLSVIFSKEKVGYTYYIITMLGIITTLVILSTSLLGIYNMIL